MSDGRTVAPIVCPFCPLHCDDLDPAQVVNGTTGCGVADQRSRAVTNASSTAIDLDAINTCRQWISDAHQIVITGYVIDLETSRAISEFAKSTGAEVDVVGSNPTAAQLLARDGAFLTTLGELSARDVSVLVIGDATSHWPRIEKHLKPLRTIVRWADTADLPRRLAKLRLLLAGRTSSDTGDDADVAQAVTMLKAASYLVVLVAPLQESISRSPVIWSSLLGLVRERNKLSRAAILSFDPSVTVRSVVAARNDPRVLDYPRSNATLRIEFSPFDDGYLNSPGRTILIGLTNKKLNAGQRHLPASVPGLHHAAMVIRGDGSVTLPLQSCLTQPFRQLLPTPAEQLRRLLSSS